jgi:hypothetical protein
LNAFLVPKNGVCTVLTFSIFFLIPKDGFLVYPKSRIGRGGSWKGMREKSGGGERTGEFGNVEK